MDLNAIFPVLVVAIVAPTILFLLTSRSDAKKEAKAVATRRTEKQEDWDRQDEVAKRAEAAAALLAENTQKAAERAAIAAETLAERTQEAAAKAEEAARTLAARTEEAAAKAATAATTLAAETKAAADLAAVAAERLYDAQQLTLQRTEEVARLAADQDTHTNEQLTRITELGEITHDLVNSDMTEARQSELDQALLTLTALRLVVSLVRKSGQEPDPADLEAIETTQARIVALQELIAKRLEQQKVIDAQMGKKGGKEHS